ncbi:MAG: cyclic pyranopterin monophosphate synthase MoaC [Bacteroidota bacterium]
MKELSHTDDQGKARMVDVSEKPIQNRKACASGSIGLSPETLNLIRDNQMKKGDVLTVAEIAGIQAAKQTSALIPLCHPLLLNKIEVRCNISDSGIDVKSLVRCAGQTGVEMEALAAVSVALLTVYDMCKAVDKNMTISNITLTEKTKEDL